MRFCNPRFMVYGLGVLAVMVVAGWNLGSVIGKAQVRRGAQSRLAKRAEALVSRTSGIRMGKIFPNLLLWSADGDQSTTLKDLLPMGGGVLYVAPGCGTCLQASTGFSRWLQSQTGTPNSAVIITDDADATPEFQRELRDSMVVIPVYCDATQSLRHENGMDQSSAFFLLKGGELELVSAGVWSESIGFVTITDSVLTLSTNGEH